MKKEIIIYDDYNSNVVRGGIIGTLTTNCGISAMRNGIKIIERLCEDDSCRKYASPCVYWERRLLPDNN